MLQNPSDSSESAQADTDHSALAWVLDEVRASLAQAAKLQRRFSRDVVRARLSDTPFTPDLSLLTQAQQQLHQVVGALELIGQDAGVQLVTVMEAATARARVESLSEQDAAALERAGHGLVEYLQAQLSGKPAFGVSLFPQYGQMQAMVGVQKIHPADLWHHEWDWVLPALALPALALSYDARVRERLDRALLRIVRQSDPVAAAQLQEISLGLAAAQNDPRLCSFWLMCTAFFESLKLRLCPIDVYAKRTVSLVFQQYTVLARGETEVSERLAHLLLFSCAQSGPVTSEKAPALAAVRAAYGLEKAQALNYSTSPYGRFDPALLGLARRRIRLVKEGWTALVAGENPPLRQVMDAFVHLAESIVQLHPASLPLAQTLVNALETVQQMPSPELGMEVATAVLYLEAVFEDFDLDDPHLGERTTRLAERIRLLMQTRQSQPLEGWMEELYRRVSDRQTMGSVVGELRLLLVEVEKALDQYFRQPGHSEHLREVPGQLNQMRGVLSVLGLEPAVRAVRSMRDSLEQLLLPGASIEQPALEALFAKLAANLGAMGLMLDMLNDQPALVRKLFVYNDEMAELQLRMGRAGQSQPTRERVNPASDLDAQPSPAPAAPAPAAASQDGAASTPPAELNLSREDEETELLHIFLEEAAEVVQKGREALALLQLQHDDVEQISVLRRAFHTLKGSSRMVGLSEFGEAAWALEQVLNACLAGTRKTSADMLTLSANALDTLENWADDLALGQARNWRSDDLRAAAQALLQGQAPSAPAPVLDPEAQAAPVAAATAVPVSTPVNEAAPAAAPVDTVAFEPVDLPPATAAEPASPLAPSHALADAAVDAAAGLAETPEDDANNTLWPATALQSEQPESVSPEPEAFDMLAAGLDRADKVSPDLDPAEPVIAHQAEPEPEPEPEPTHASEQLIEPEAQAVVPAGPILGLVSHEQAAPVEPAMPALDVAAAEAEALPPEPLEIQLLPDEQVKVIGDLRVGIPLYNVYLTEADEWSRRLVTETTEWSMELQRPAPDAAVALAHALAGSSATVGFSALSSLARALEHAVQHVQLMPRGTAEQAQLFMDAAEDIRHLLHQFAAGFLKTPDPRILHELQTLLWTPVSPTESTGFVDLEADEAQQRAAPAVQLVDDEIDAVDSLDDELFDIFREEAQDLLQQLSAVMRQWMARNDNAGASTEVLRLLHTLKGGARLCGAMRLGEMAHHMETAVQALPASAVHGADLEPLLQRQDQMLACYEALCAGSSAAPAAADGPDAADEFMAAPAFAATDAPALDATTGGAATDPAQGPPAEAGELAAPAFAPAVPSFSETAASLALPAFAPGPQASASVSSLPRGNEGPAVRVRTRLMDRLLNQAGEVMTSRLRMDNNVNSLRLSLGDLTGNLERLRQQLRELELQAELQMQSRMAQTRDTEQAFDPLEFDRFTRVQELTRMMAESVDDVATVQRTLSRALDATEGDLANQARQARDLQRDLLRTRMVEFESLSERLYRVVRQAAKDTGKRVQMDIEGGAIEIDRSVLERMTPAFEHLLRNAVAHGVEDAALRQQRGKSEAGTITIVLQQEGNDVAISFVDDGGGFDLARIRERALSLGLRPEGAEHLAPEDWSDAHVISLVFQSGLSTAESISALAGRGVGMDVVRADVQALGGRIEAQTAWGQGSRFKLVLPLTTAITQVVMLRVGQQMMGVPASLIERVRREPLAALAQAQAQGEYPGANGPVPFFWAGALLRDSARSQEIVQGKTAPLVLVRSAAQTVALHVDEVMGNKEVVVKNLGPQLARMPGLAGLSIMPDGEVALIYNPVALAQVYGERVREWQARAIAPVLADALDAGPALEPSAPEPAADKPAQPPLVMVVDDSITVRRVTQRLLQREGFRVALAYDGMQALEKLLDERPSVILSDIEMPRMDGFDLVRNLRANDDWVDLPVIMITSRIAEKHRERARELGVQHYLGKPYSEEELLQLVRGYTHTAATPAEGLS